MPVTLNGFYSLKPKNRSYINFSAKLSVEINKPIKVSELIKKSAATSTQIKTLIDKSIFEEYYLQTDRVLFENTIKSDSKKLNKHQEKNLKL